MLPQIHFIFITHCLVQVVFCQRIHLFPYKLEDNCSISVVEENDTIIMFGKVDFNGNIPASSVVNFEIKRKNDTSFQFFCVLKVPKDCDKVFNYCNCFKTDVNKVFKLSLHITAFTENSEADTRAELVYRETSFFSKTRHLPLVYGSKTDLVVVYANDQPVHFQQTDVSINVTQVTIVSLCRKNFAHDCKLQLSDFETGALLNSGKEMIVYNTNIKDRSNFKLKYSVCNIERNISFSITTDKRTDYLHLTTETNPVVIILPTVSIMTLAMMFFIVIFVRTPQRCPAREKNQTDRKPSKLITDKIATLAHGEITVHSNAVIRVETEAATSLVDNVTRKSFPQDTCGLNDPPHFTSVQSKVLLDDAESPLIGDYEKKESEGGEDFLHKYLVGCKKNPGHSQFIPVDTFTLMHLPEGLQDIDLFEYIKAIADLTVRINVKMTSSDRPKFWPETSQPYPFYNISEKRNLRTGSGRVRYVMKKFQDGIKHDEGYGSTNYTQCWCRKCKDSDSPSNVWWELDVTTAAHVVFDDVEANHTTLRLFYDRDKSPEVSVDKVTVVDVNVEHNFCVLKCVTCDKNLGNKLMEMWEHLENVRWKVYNKYKDSRSQHKFTFIVSHPHGCSKQVSFGQWKHRIKVGGGYKFAYTTCTCPGSSGANVNCLGYNDLTWSGLVHSGILKPGLNYSGVGYVY